jgi:pSer/pThr/pTyr-binding forkhead associated (FHA) protein
LKRVIKELFVEIELRGRVESHSVDSFDFVAGRSDKVDMPLMIKEMSRQHLRVSAREGQIFVTDLGSKNGTKLNGEVIPQNQEVLYPIGAPLQFGKSKEIMRIRARVEAVKAEPVADIEPADDSDMTMVRPSSAANQAASSSGSMRSEDMSEGPSEVPKVPSLDKTDVSIDPSLEKTDLSDLLSSDKTDVSHELAKVEKTQIVPNQSKTHVLSREDLSKGLESTDSLVLDEADLEIESSFNAKQEEMPESLTMVMKNPESLIDANEVNSLKEESAKDLKNQRLEKDENGDVTIRPLKNAAESISSPGSQEELSIKKLSQDEDQRDSSSAPRVPDPPAIPKQTFARPMHIPKNTQTHTSAMSAGTKSGSRKVSFSKLENVKELVAEITRDASKAIDENFLNIPPEKRAARKAEKILTEVRKVAAELQEKAYDKHDRIIKKASQKATDMLTEAEADRDQILTEGREIIRKMKANQERANEEALDKIIDEANAKAKDLIEDAENLAENIDSEAHGRLSDAKLEAQRLIDENGKVADQIVAKAEREAENIVNAAVLKKEQAELETSELEARADELETLIGRLEDEIEGWEEKVRTSKNAAEGALEQAQIESGKLEAHKKLIEQQQTQLTAEFEDFKKQREEDKAHFIRQVEDDERRVSQSLEDHRSRVEAEKALLLKDYESQRQRLNADYVRAQEQHEKKLGDLDQQYKDKDAGLNVEYMKRRDDIDKKTEEYQADHDQKRAEIESHTLAAQAFHDQQREQFEKETESFRDEQSQKRQDIANSTEAFRDEHYMKRQDIEKKTLDFQSEHEQKRQKFEEETERVQSEFDELNAELEGEKQNLTARIESLTQNVRELSRTRDDIQGELRESEKRILDNQDTWKQASADYEFAITGKKNAEKEKAELENQKSELNQLILQLREKRQSIEDSIDNLENTKAQELKNISIMKEEALKQIGLERARVSEEIKSEQEAWQVKAEKMQSDAERRSEQLLASASRVKAEAESEAEKIVAQARRESQALAQQVESWKKEQEASMAEHAEAWERELESSKAQALARQKEEEAAFASEMSSKRDQLSREIESAKADGVKQTQMQIADMRVKRTSEIEAELEQLRAQYEAQKEERAKVLAKSLDAKLITHLKPLLGEKATSDEIDNVSSELQKVVMNVMLPDGDFKDEDFRELIGAQATELVSSKSFWKKTAIVAASLFVILGSSTAYRSFKIHTKEMASKQKEEADKAYQKKLEEKEKNKPKFEPEMKDVYYAKYTDRVLYTKGYVENELEPKYREQWILDLDKFFVEKLGLSENVIITFIAKESNLIKELRDSRAAINPMFVEEARTDMLKIEDVFLQEIQKTLKSQGNYEKYLSFKQKYYSDKYIPRQPAAE